MTLQRFRARAVAVLAGGLVIVPLLAGLVLPLDPDAGVLTDRLQGPSAAHLLGTDQFGRDTLARLLVGARISIGVTLVLLAVCVVLGTAVGMLSAGSSGGAGRAVERVVDVLVAVPTIVVGLVLAAALEPGLPALCLAVLLTGWTPFARVARNLTRSAMTSGWVTVSTALGGSRWHVLRWSVLPNITPALVAHACLRYANTLLTVAGLSFLGLGVQPPTAEWGAMIADGRRYLSRDPLLVLFPSLAVVAVTLAIGALGRILVTRQRRQSADAVDRIGEGIDVITQR